MEQLFPIARLRCGFDEKFGIPRQAGLAANIPAKIVFEPGFRNPEALRGLEDFDYIWLIWGFSANGPKWEPTVRPPRLGGNARMGLWATRSPFRPNALGLSCVRITGIELSTSDGPVIEVSGADLMDGTPIFDIKPYVCYADSHPDARSGFVDNLSERSLEVVISENVRLCADESFLTEITSVLSYDPRPSYQDDPRRIYGMSYRGRNVRFSVSGHTLTVISII